MKRLLFLLSLSLLGSCGTVRAVTGNIVSSGGVVVQIHYVDQATINYTYTIPGGMGGWLYKTTGDGGPYGFKIFDTSPQSTAMGGATLGIQIGEWLRLGARVPNGSGGYNDTHVYYQHQVPTAAGAGTGKKIVMTYKNTSTTETMYIGVQNDDEPGIVHQGKYVGPGETYTTSVAVEANDTSTYRLVSVDADQAFKDGGGSIDMYESPDGSRAYDFAGYTTNIGPSYTVAANAVPSGQTNVGESTVDTSTTPQTQTTKQALTNPRHVSTTGPNAGLATTQGSNAANTNAVTMALKDVKDAIQGGITVAPTDMGATNAKLDAINATLTSANNKKDATNTKLDTLNATQTQVAAKLDTLNAAATTANGKRDTTNATLAAGNIKLDAIVAGQGNVTAAVNAQKTATELNGAKLDQIKAAVDNVGTKVDTSNTHLEALAKFSKGEGPGQGGAYDNAAKLNEAQTAAVNVSPYTGKKPTVGGALSVQVSTSQTQWGKYKIGGEEIVFGFGALKPEYETLLASGRPVLLVALCLGFCRLASKTLTQYTVAMPQVLSQDTGFGPENIGPGVSQAKTYATAAVAVGIIFAGVASMVALVDTWVAYYGGGVAKIFDPWNSPALAAVGQIDKYVPVAAGLGLTVLGVALPYVVAPMYLGTAAIIRFIKT